MNPITIPKNHWTRRLLRLPVVGRGDNWITGYQVTTCDYYKDVFLSFLFMLVPFLFVSAFLAGCYIYVSTSLAHPELFFWNPFENFRAGVFGNQSGLSKGLAAMSFSVLVVVTVGAVVAVLSYVVVWLIVKMPPMPKLNFLPLSSGITRSLWESWKKKLCTPVKLED